MFNIWVVLYLSLERVFIMQMVDWVTRPPGEGNSHASACLYLWDYWTVTLKHICPQGKNHFAWVYFLVKDGWSPVQGCFTDIYMFGRTLHTPFCMGSCLLCRNGHFSAMFPSRMPKFQGMNFLVSGTTEQPKAWYRPSYLTGIPKRSSWR